MDTKHFIYFIIPTLYARETNKSLLKKIPKLLYNISIKAILFNTKFL